MDLRLDLRVRAARAAGRAGYCIELRIVDDADQELPRDGVTSGRLQCRGPWIIQRYFKADADAQKQLASTVPLASVDPEDFDAVFYPGGHGPLWDLAEDRTSIALIERFQAQNKPVAAVCHAPGVLRHVKAANGLPLVNGKKVTGFSNSEEAAVQLTEVVPFLVQDMLIANGGHYSSANDWQSHVLVDGLLITGQNPSSSDATAEALITLLKSR